MCAKECAATSGGLSALDAAHSAVRRARHDLALLNGLDGLRGSPEASTDKEASEGSKDQEEPTAMASPLSQVPPVTPVAPVSLLAPLSLLATANGAGS